MKLKLKFNLIKGILIITIGVVLFMLLTFFMKPSLSGQLRAKFRDSGLNDSLMYDSRQMGNIRLDKFVALSVSKPIYFDSTCIIIDSDSVTFKVRQPQMFFGADAGDWWRGKYNNIPIRIIGDSSFKARINEINGRKYIYIPYQILACLVDFIGNRISSDSDQGDGVKDSNGHFITFDSEKDIEHLAENGGKIQTEGIVLKNVSDILAMNNYKGGDKYKQLEILWDYTKSNWIYISDPAGVKDTWRSAAETIENYYFTSDKRYTGDCDDFAILMASFARQVGFNSHFVVVIGPQGGHAYAEFQRESDGVWIPLDWVDEFGGTPFNGKRIRIYNDL